MSSFGPTIDSGDVERAARDVLQAWLDTYLHEMEDRKGLARGSIARPNSWMRVNQLDDFQTRRLPAIMVIAPGLTEPPLPDGQGRYRCKWAVAVGIVVSSHSAEEARDLVQMYGATVRKLMIQKPSLGGFAVATEWADERNEILGTFDRRSVAVSREVFVVEVTDVDDRRGGPITSTPDPGVDEPHPDWGQAETVQLDVQEA